MPPSHSIWWVRNLGYLSFDIHPSWLRAAPCYFGLPWCGLRGRATGAMYWNGECWGDVVGAVVGGHSEATRAHESHDKHLWALTASYTKTYQISGFYQFRIFKCIKKFLFFPLSLRISSTCLAPTNTTTMTPSDSFLLDPGFMLLTA